MYVTERSLRELDLARRYLLIRAYESVGVKVISDKEAGSIKADITMREFRRDQPNLGKSISRLLACTQLHTYENNAIKDLKPPLGVGVLGR